VQLVDRIEKRRFVGREFLLWLWFESELFDATLQTADHGPFGLWLEKKLVLSEGKESTRITSPMPGAGREAKEALLRGQLPESAGIRVALHDDETSFVIKAESLGVAALKLQTVLDKDDQGPNELLEELTGQKGRKKRKEPTPEDAEHEAFYERMGMASDFEALVEALFRDFLALRLSAAWRESVLPLMRQWVDGKEFDLAPYEALRRSERKVQGALELPGARTPSLTESGELPLPEVDDVVAVAAAAPDAPEPALQTDGASALAEDGAIAAEQIEPSSAEPATSDEDVMDVSDLDDLEVLEEDARAASAE